MSLLPQLSRNLSIHVRGHALRGRSSFRMAGLRQVPRPVRTGICGPAPGSAESSRSAGRKAPHQRAANEVASSARVSRSEVSIRAESDMPRDRAKRSASSSSASLTVIVSFRFMTGTRKSAAGKSGSVFQSSYVPAPTTHSPLGVLRQPNRASERPRPPLLLTVPRRDPARQQCGICSSAARRT